MGFGREDEGDGDGVTVGIGITSHRLLVGPASYGFLGSEMDKMRWALALRLCVEKGQCPCVSGAGSEKAEEEKEEEMERRRKMKTENGE